MESTELMITTAQVGKTVVVTVLGDVDLSSADRLREELDAALRESRIVVVDVRGMSFIDSSGLNALVHAHRSAHAGGADLRVRHPTAMFLRLLQITQLETFFVIDESCQPPSVTKGPAS